MPDTIESVFRQMKEAGKNNLESIVNWMKEADIIDEKFTEEKAKMMYDGMDAAKVELVNFTSFLSRVAAEKKIDLDNVERTLMAASTRYAAALKAGYEAFANNLGDDK